MENITIEGKKLNLDKIRNIKKIKDGFYAIIKEDGLVINAKLKASTAKAAINQLRVLERVSPAITGSDKPEKKSAPIKNDDINKSIERIEKNFGSFLDVFFKDENLAGYWEDDKGIPKRLALGYTFSRPDDLKDFDMQFADVRFGLEKSPDGYIKRGELTLMHGTKEVKEAILNHHYNKRSNIRQINGYEQTY